MEGNKTLHLMPQNGVLLSVICEEIAKKSKFSEILNNSRNS